MVRRGHQGAIPATDQSFSPRKLSVTSSPSRTVEESQGSSLSVSCGGASGGASGRDVGRASGLASGGASGGTSNRVEFGNIEVICDDNQWSSNGRCEV